jgi:hypothetical protein
MSDNESLLSGLQGSFGGRTIEMQVTSVDLNSRFFQNMTEEIGAPRANVEMALGDGTKVVFEDVEFEFEGGSVKNAPSTAGIVAGGTVGIGGSDDYASIAPNTIGGWTVGSLPGLEYTFETKDQKIARLERELGLAILRAERAEGHVDRLMTMLESAMEVFE